MTADAIREALNTVPYVPFAVRLTDGRKFAVRHPDFAAVSPTGRTMTIYPKGDRFVVLDVALITQLECKESAARGS